VVGGVRTVNCGGDATRACGLRHPERELAGRTERR
jgi:hypothetical protein